MLIEACVGLVLISMGPTVPWYHFKDSNIYIHYIILMSGIPKAFHTRAAFAMNGTTERVPEDKP